MHPKIALSISSLKHITQTQNNLAHGRIRSLSTQVLALEESPMEEGSRKILLCLQHWRRTYTQVQITTTLEFLVS